jgi:uncharacterized DUF497 family protein
MVFEWDEVKNRRNVAKHGLGFERASTIFQGFCIVDEDTRSNYGERRYVAVGLLEGLAVVVVVCTERGGRIRIISARPASRRERNRYYEALQKRTDG